MDIFKEIRPLKAFLESSKRDSDSIGFVPTMGALHQGHLSLIQASKRENAKTICSIYINPTQFNNPDDLAKYPKTLARDIELLTDVGCDVLFCPENKEMYSVEPRLKFDFGSLERVLEGKYRPGHFSGVALVISKLFHIVSPNKAYFGQKDFQQFKIIEQLVEELKFDVSLRCMPIERESDGLAMSSRNTRLSAEQKEKATTLYKCLLLASNLIKDGHTMDSIRKKIESIFLKVDGIKLEYFELANTTNLMSLKYVADKSSTAILLIAGYVGEVRLIDNLLLTDEN
ncbi:MAG: pantoate--beta-alanine ligase [Cyclobacteriaceae bacterium]|nr:pantoate--beta-alanine ligase [Cyclobacteriaceae bacterium]